jgi:hypothetical protein
MHELATEYGVHPVPITQGKKLGLAALPKRFSSHRGATPTAAEALTAALYQPIGQWKVALEWRKKNVASLRGGDTPVDRAGPSTVEPPSPRRAVHKSGLHGAAAAKRECPQYGWLWPGLGPQMVCLL